MSTYCADQAKRLDPDRYLTALFAPAERRADLMALYAFNSEVARSREAVSEPILGRIRLQWWREAIAECYEGDPRRHYVIQPLAAAIRRRALSRSYFDRLIDAREEDLEDGPPETLEALVAYAGATSGGLAHLALEILGVRDDAAHEAGDLAGTAFALAGMLRALPHYLRQGRNILPRAVMARHAVNEAGLRALKPSTEISKTVEEITVTPLKQIQKTRLYVSGKMSGASSVLLLATLAEAYLKRLSRLGHDPFDGRNAGPLRFRSWRLIIPALTGRF